MMVTCDACKTLANFQQHIDNCPYCEIARLRERVAELEARPVVSVDRVRKLLVERRQHLACVGSLDACGELLYIAQRLGISVPASPIKCIALDGGEGGGDEQ